MSTTHCTPTLVRLFEVEEKNKGKVVSDTCVVEYGDDMLDFALVSMSSTLYSDEKWILDICCTDHMCLNREWFFNYEEQDDEVVFMGNDSLYKTIGIRSIRLKNQDKSTKVLTNVWCLLSLQKNLMSLEF